MLGFEGPETLRPLNQFFDTPLMGVCTRIVIIFIFLTAYVKTRMLKIFQKSLKVDKFCLHITPELSQREIWFSE